METTARSGASSPPRHLRRLDHGRDHQDDVLALLLSCRRTCVKAFKTGSLPSLATVFDRYTVDASLTFGRGLDMAIS